MRRLLDVLNKRPKDFHFRTANDVLRTTGKDVIRTSKNGDFNKSEKDVLWLFYNGIWLNVQRHHFSNVIMDFDCSMIIYKLSFIKTLQ